MSDPSTADRLIDNAAAIASGDAATGTDDRRDIGRVEFTNLVAVILLQDDGSVSPVQVLRAKDLSRGGVCVLSKGMMHEGAKGAVQLVNSNGATALVGIEICYCRYVGNMQHEIGLRFVERHPRLQPEHFLDDQGRMPLLDGRLSEYMPDES